LLGVLDALNKFGFSIKPLSKYGRTLHIRLQWAELCKWGPMVETPSTPEKGLWPIELWRDLL
jgi:hypothetical protein